MVKRLSIALVAVLGVGIAAPAGAVGNFSAGQWRGEAFFHNAKFTHCAINANQRAWKLTFIMTKGGAVHLGLHNKSLKFAEASKLEGSMQIGNAPAANQVFTALRPDIIGAPLGRTEALPKLAQASRLKIKVGEVAADFNLTGIRDALARLSSCVEKAGTK